MEIIENETVTWLSDHEVRELLLQQSAPSTGRRQPQSLMTLEYELSEYLRASPSSRLTHETLARLLGFLAELKLERVERLMIVNLLPKSAVEWHAMIEECEERFSEAEINEILERIGEIIGDDKE